MRICIYTTTFYPTIGGMETFVYLLAKEFVTFGDKVTVFTEVKNKNKDK